MTREEKQKAIDALKISAPVMAVTQEEFNDYIHILNHVMDWLEQEPRTGQWIVHPKGIYAHLICDKCLSNAPYDCRTDYCPNCGCRMVEPTCDTCEYTTAAFNPCNACKDKSEYKPQERSEDAT